KFSALKPQAEGSSPSPSVSPPTEDKGGAEKAEAQYLSANCVLFTYYSGDISSVVDEHFARALSQVTPSYTPQPSEAKSSSHSSKGEFSVSSKQALLFETVLPDQNGKIKPLKLLKNKAKHS
ncbi:hypothetical protein AVEN_232850-1, partial [Araneus ventricosus]